MSLFKHELVLKIKKNTQDRIDSIQIFSDGKKIKGITSININCEAPLDYDILAKKYIQGKNKGQLGYIEYIGERSD